MAIHTAFTTRATLLAGFMGLALTLTLTLTPAQAQEAESAVPLPLAAPTSEFSKELLAALELKDPTARVASFLTGLGKCDASNVGELRALWMILIREGRNDQAIEAHVNRTVARVVGSAALEKRRDVSPDNYKFAAVRLELEGAMVSDSSGTRKWYDSLTNEPLREALLPTYVGALAQADRAQALEVLDKISPEFQKSCASTILRTCLFRMGYKAIVGWVHDTLKSPDILHAPAKIHLFHECLSLLKDNPNPAPFLAIMVEDTKNEPYVDFSQIPALGRAYAHADGKKATEWANRLCEQKPGEYTAALLTAVAAVSAGK